MKLVTTAFRKRRKADDDTHDVAALSRVEPLSEREARYIPDGDFVSPTFDVDSPRRPCRMIVLLSTPRSGSTYLCDLLHRAGICTPHEYFQPAQYLPLLAHRWCCVERGHVSAVSLSIAQQTGQWTSLFRARAEATYDRSQILKALQRIHAEEDLIAAYLHTRSFSCSTLYYEDVVRTPRDTLRSALGVEIDEGARRGTALHPQGGRKNDAWVRLLSREMFLAPHDGVRELTTR